MARWNFYRSGTGGNETWSWRRTHWDLTVTASDRTFADYDSCLADATRHGYDENVVAIVSTAPEPDRPKAASRRKAGNGVSTSANRARRT
jgi:hypothetical protein